MVEEKKFRVESIYEFSSPVNVFFFSSRRFYGSYENLSQGGSTTRALQDLTGGIVQSFGLSNQDRYLTYQVLNSAVPRSSLLIASINLVSLGCGKSDLAAFISRRNFICMVKNFRKRTNVNYA